MKKSLFFVVCLFCISGCSLSSLGKEQSTVEDVSYSHSGGIVQNTGLGGSEVSIVVDKEKVNIISDSMIGDSECKQFTKNLEKCTVSTCEFTHPFANIKVQRRIKGLVGGLCVTEEDMPNNGLMTCKYRENERMLAVKYYDKVSESTDIKVSIQLDDEGSISTEHYDDEKMEWTLNNMIQNGGCVISGYDDSGF